MLGSVLAPNASALTLDGTRTYLVGRSRVVVIDPGSADPGHLDAIVAAVRGGRVTAIAVSHDHPDHAAGADDLAVRLGAPVRMARRGTLMEGDRLETDAGGLTALATPGHTEDHMALYWPEADAVFCGDLMMGGQDTALVAAPEGRLAPYLTSLDRIRKLRPRVIHPSHGPSFDRPDEALDRYRRHRSLRLDQVLAAVREGAAETSDFLGAVYGPDLDPALEAPAAAALAAYLDYLQGVGRIRRLGRGWEAVS